VVDVGDDGDCAKLHTTKGKGASKVRRVDPV
jgi:hypothetical protein